MSLNILLGNQVTWPRHYKDFDILTLKDFFFFCTLLKVLRQGISSFISLAILIIDLEIISKISLAQQICLEFKLFIFINC